jgi:hypothetical protein
MEGAVVNLVAVIHGRIHRETTYEWSGREASGAMTEVITPASLLRVEFCYL